MAKVGLEGGGAYSQDKSTCAETLAENGRGGVFVGHYGITCTMSCTRTCMSFVLPLYMRGEWNSDTLKVVHTREGHLSL